MLSSPVAFSTALNTFRSRISTHDQGLDNLAQRTSNAPVRAPAVIETTHDEVTLLLTPPPLPFRLHTDGMEPLSIPPHVIGTRGRLPQHVEASVSVPPLNPHIAVCSRQLCAAMGIVCEGLMGEHIGMEWFARLSYGELDEAISRVADVRNCWKDWFLGLSCDDAARFGTLVHKVSIGIDLKCLPWIVY